jgi:hypothetical protein
MSIVRRMLSIATAGLAVAGCVKKEAPPAAPSAVTVTYTGTEYAFTGPDSIASGLVTVRLVNAGKEPHQLGLVRIDSGKTLADIATAMKATAGPIPGWMTFVGGPNAIMPGDSTAATQALTAGNYLLVCFIPAPDGKMHLEHGMVRMVVVAGSAPAAAEPAADNTITLSDYTFVTAQPLTAGPHTFRVENAGPQLHEVEIMRLLPGKTMGDFQIWAMNMMKGPPPAVSVGGIVGLTTGRHAQFSATLTPGTYIFLCFVPDEKDGKPHVAHGMMKTFTVS